MKYVTIHKFHDLSGYTEDAVRTKIKRGIWLEGLWIKAPDNRILINIEAYEKWVESQAFGQHLKQA